MDTDKMEFALIAVALTFFLSFPVLIWKHENTKIEMFKACLDKGGTPETCALVSGIGR